MTYYSDAQLWNFFVSVLPSVARDVKKFNSHKGNSIVLWFSDHEPFIFTKLSDTKWTLEPMER